MKYLVVVFIDLVVEVLNSTETPEIQKIIKNRLRVLLDKKQNLEIRDVNVKVVETLGK